MICFSSFPNSIDRIESNASFNFRRIRRRSSGNSCRQFEAWHVSVIFAKLSENWRIGAFFTELFIKDSIIILLPK